MHSAPVVSVILSVKDGERFIAEAIESILASTLRDFELLIVDGYSTDSTCQIAGRYKEVKLLPQTSTGIAAAWNQGITAATADLIAFASADDLWLPEKLALQVAELKRDSSIEYVVGHATFFLEPGCGIPTGFRRELLEGLRPAFIQETLLARRSVFDKVGTFDPSLKISEDVDWYARARDLNIKYALLPDELVRKRVHDHNTSMLNDNSSLLLALQRSAQRKRSSQQT